MEHKQNDTSMEMADKGNGDKPIPIKGEVAWADPSRLFTGSEKIQQYNPSLLITRKGYQIIDKMRNDDQVKACMSFKKHAIFSTGFDIESPDGEDQDWEPKIFLERVFDQMEGSLYESLLQILTGLEYGFSVSEKIVESKDIGFGNQVVLTAIKTRKPHSFEFLADEFGNLKTLKQYQLSGGWAFSGAGVELPIDKFVIFVNNMEWGNFYGKGDLESAYRSWWIKDNSYKWYSMLLERRGIPPIFALYDPNQFQAGLIDNLKEVMESIQAATTGVIPRATPEGLEFWAPQLAREASDVFQKAIDMFNMDISRSVLMPGLLGFTPDQQQGSYARSQVHFDVFMMVVDFIRRRIEDNIMFEQVCKPLLDLNYPNLVEYPKFRFKPLTEDIRLDIMDRWIVAVEKGVVTQSVEDEEHIRTVLNFPEKTQAEPIIPPVQTPPGNPSIPGQSISTPPSEIPPQTPPPLKAELELSMSRPPNKFEKRVDFARIENRLRQLEDNTKTELITLLIEARDAMVGFVERNWKDLPKMLDDLRLKGWSDVQSVIGEFLKQAYDIGAQEMNAEVGHLQMAKKGPMFTPVDALRFLRSKATYVSGVLKDSLIKEIKTTLYNAIKVGEIPTETQGKIKQLFDPYIGNEDVLKPDKDGVMRVTEPYRIETILRTNATDALNQGRLVEARQVEKFLQGMEYSAILDDRTTQICIDLDGKIFHMDDPNLQRLTPPNHFNALPAGTPILATSRKGDGGWINIEDITIGTYVYTHKGRYRPVTEVMKHDVWKYDEIVLYFGEGHNLVITEDHPVLTTKGWVCAGDLTISDELVSISGPCLICNKWVYRRKYCSYECAGKGRSLRKKIRFCKNCGKETTNKTFCSHACQGAYSTDRYRSGELKGTEKKNKYCVRSGCESKIKKEGAKLYCSTVCSGKDRGLKRRKRKEAFCEVCGKISIVPINNTKKRFCSRMCKNKSQKTRPQKFCEICQKEIMRDSWGKEWSAVKYCSQKCSGEGLRIHEPRPCLTCGIIMVGGSKKEPTKSGVIRIGLVKDRKFCSMKCYLSYKGPTSIELEVKQWLINSKVEYIFQKTFGRFVVDFYLPDYNIIVEVDGEYWHGESKGDKVKAINRDRYLLGLGLTIVHIPESAVHSGRFVKFIKEALYVQNYQSTENRTQTLQ